MNEGNFVTHGMRIGGNLRWNFDGISYVNFGGYRNQIQKSMYIPWYFSGFYGSTPSNKGLSIRGFDFEVKFRIEPPDFPLKFHPKRGLAVHKIEVYFHQSSDGISMFWIFGIPEFLMSYIPHATPLIFLLPTTHATTTTCPKLPTYYSTMILRNLQRLGMHV